MDYFTEYANKVLKDIKFNTCNLRNLKSLYYFKFKKIYHGELLNKSEKEQKLEIIKSLKHNKVCKEYYIDGELKK